jgi:hypothetical protein
VPVTVAMARATRWLRSGIVAADPLGSESADAAANCGNTTQGVTIGVQVGIPGSRELPCSWPTFRSLLACTRL